VRAVTTLRDSTSFYSVHVLKYFRRTWISTSQLGDICRKPLFCIERDKLAHFSDQTEVALHNLLTFVLFLLSALFQSAHFRYSTITVITLVNLHENRRA